MACYQFHSTTTSLMNRYTVVHESMAVLPYPNCVPRGKHNIDISFHNKSTVYVQMAVHMKENHKF